MGYGCLHLKGFDSVKRRNLSRILREAEQIADAVLQQQHVIWTVKYMKMKTESKYPYFKMIPNLNEGPISTFETCMQHFPK